MPSASRVERASWPIVTAAHVKRCSRSHDAMIGAKKSLGRHRPRLFLIHALLLAVAVAHWSVVEAHGAGAATFLAAAQAIAHCLNHFLADFVAGLAADADAVGRHFAGAMAAGEIALAQADAVPATANGAHPAGECAAEVLQRFAANLIFANAVDFAAVGALFNADFALRNNAAGVVRSGIAGLLGSSALGVQIADRKSAVLQQSIRHDPFPQNWLRAFGLSQLAHGCRC